MKHSEIELNKLAKKITSIKQGLIEFEIEDAHKVQQQLTSILVDKIEDTYNVSDTPVFAGDKVIVTQGEYAGEIFTVKHRDMDFIGCLSQVLKPELKSFRGITVYKGEVGGQETLDLYHGEYRKIEEEGSIKERFKTEKRTAYKGDRILVTSKNGDEQVLMVKAHNITCEEGVYLRYIDETRKRIYKSWTSFTESSYEVIVEQEPLTNDQKRYKAVELSSSFLWENEFKDSREKESRVEFKVDLTKLSVTGYLVDYTSGETLREYTLNRELGEVFNEYIFKAKVYSELKGVKLPEEVLGAPQPSELREGMVVTGNRESTRDFYNKNKRFTLRRETEGKWEYVEDSKDWLLESNVGEIILDDYKVYDYSDFCRYWRSIR